MNKLSSCIAIFSNQPEANTARQLLLEAQIDKKSIFLLDKNFQGGSLIKNINQFFNYIGVPEDTAHCYLCLLHSGSLLLIVSGVYQDVEFACEQLEKNDLASPSMHINAMKIKKQIFISKKESNNAKYELLHAPLKQHHGKK